MIYQDGIQNAMSIGCVNLAIYRNDEATDAKKEHGERNEAAERENGQQQMHMMTRRGRVRKLQEHEVNSIVRHFTMYDLWDNCHNIYFSPKCWVRLITKTETERE